MTTAQETQRLAFTVVHGPWYSDGKGPLEDGGYVDDVVVDDPSPELVRLASHSHAAGVLEVTEGLDLSDVQSDEDAGAALEAARGEWLEEVRDSGGRIVRPGRWSGPWQEGHAAQIELDAAAKPVTKLEHALKDLRAARVAAEEAGEEPPADLPDGPALLAELAEAQEHFEAVAQAVAARLGGEES